MLLYKTFKMYHFFNFFFHKPIFWRNKLVKPFLKINTQLCSHKICNIQNANCAHCYKLIVSYYDAWMIVLDHFFHLWIIITESNFRIYSISTSIYSEFNLQFWRWIFTLLWILEECLHQFINLKIISCIYPPSQSRYVNN